MVGHLVNQVNRTFGKERKCSSANSLSSSGTQSKDLEAALQTSPTKVTTCTLPKAKYRNEKREPITLIKKNLFLMLYKPIN